MAEEDKSKIEKLEERIEELEKQKRDNINNSTETEKEKKISRRNFLKKAGLGTAGLAAISLLPASALDIKDSKGLQVYQKGTEYLDITNSGIQITNTDLNLNSNNITNTNNLEVNNQLTDPSGTQHTGQLADTTDISNIQNSSDITITDTNPGTLSDGQYLKNNNGTLTGDTPSGVPKGAIIMWSGSTTNIPTGWTLCDGNNENGQTVPDLRNKFIVGAGDQYPVGNTGGQQQVQLTVNEMPSHSHDYTYMKGTRYIYYNSSDPDNAADQTTGTGITTENGGDQPHENRPPYYALAYIMKL